MLEDFDTALQRALGRLRTSDRFESDIRGRLTEFSPETVDAVITHLRAKGILDDRRTSEATVRKYSGKRTLGRLALAERDVAVDQLPNDAEERDRLWSLLTSRYRSSDNPMKAGRFLAGRGFRSDDIEWALERYFAELAE